jgi:hypothetical protein
VIWQYFGKMMAAAPCVWRCPISFDTREQAILLSLYGDQEKTILGGSTYLVGDGVVCFAYVPPPEQHHVEKLAQFRRGLTRLATARRVLATLNAPLTHLSDVTLALASIGSALDHEDDGVQETQYRDGNVSCSIVVDGTRPPAIVLDEGLAADAWLASIVDEVSSVAARAALFDATLTVTVVTVGPLPLHSTRWVRALYGVPTEQMGNRSVLPLGGLMGHEDRCRLVAIWCTSVAYVDERIYGFANPWADRKPSMQVETDFYCALGHEKGQIVFNSGYDAANFLEM